MKRTYSTIRIGRYIQTFRENKRLIMLISVLIAGLITGAALAGNSSDKLSFIVEGFIDARSNQSFVSTFLNSLLSTSIFLLAAFMFGLCVCGAPFIPAILFIRGLGLGYAMGYLYTFEGLKGIAFVALLIAPNAVISSFALVPACLEGMRVSTLLFSSTAKDAPAVRLWPDMKKYSIRFAACAVLLCIGSIVDSLFVLAFSRFFV